MVSKFIFKKRNGELTRVGLFVGTIINGELKTGFSLCSKEDEFDLGYAVALASVRLLAPDPIPASLQARHKEFIQLCIENLEDFTYQEEESYIVEVG